ncbi:MAG: DNA/RNA non-specific endonuclease [Bacteroidales bacterium]|nr:DNA/RNA non-specific endonuclease [Bacteroidales bacterium]
MKTAACFRNIALAVLSALALASCSKDILQEDSPVGVYTFTIAGDNTRSVLAEDEKGYFGRWESGDRLGTAVADGMPGYSYVNPGTPVSFNIYRPGGLTAGEKLYVYYPYSPDTRSVGAVQMEIPELQYQNGSVFDYNAMPMAAAPFEITQTVVNDKYNPLGDVHLYNLASVAGFRVFSSSGNFAGELIESIEFEADAPLAGSFVLDLGAFDVEETAISGYEIRKVVTNVARSLAVTDQTGAVPVFMVVAPGTYGGKVAVTTDKAVYTFSLKNPQTFRRSVLRSFGIDLDSCLLRESLEEDYTYLHCFEVPSVESAGTYSGEEIFGSTQWYAHETADPARRVVTHTYLYDGKVRRNYTAMVDRDKRCPLWTAYVMHGEEYPDNKVGRAGSFNSKTSYDPAIPKAWQSSGSTADYNNGNGYSRGHHCASNDRQASEDANKQTFYYTNQSPQWYNKFNGGMWATLEGKVQGLGISGRDTLYVVVGTLFEDGNSGSSNDGGEVARPSHFYKLLLKCSYNEQGVVIAAKGAAYLYSNEAHTGSYNAPEFCTTIDALEERTGFDFFPRLPASLAAAEASFTNFF